MAVPKKRTAPSKRDHRRSHHATKPIQLAACPRCHAPVRPHTACPDCGTYRGREVIDVMRRLDKRARKTKEKELEQHEHAEHEHAE